MPIFNTDQLLLRPYEASDFDHVWRLQSDAETMRYIRVPASDPEAVLERTELWLQYAREQAGLGVWIIEQSQDGAFVGYVVLRHVDFQPGREIELGYTLDKSQWGKGYATEACHVLMEYAKTQLQISNLVAYTDEHNGASNRVLEKCGFILNGRERVYDADCLRWEISL